MPTLERLCEDVHRTTLALRDTALAAKQLAKQGNYSSPAEHGERMRAVGRDDVVLAGERLLHPHRNGFLSTPLGTYERCSEDRQQPAHTPDRW